MNDARATVLALLDARAPGATICPSEAARKMADGLDAGGAIGNWRDAMPVVHETVDGMVEEGLITLSWKGAVLTRRDGPYRIRRAKG